MEEDHNNPKFINLENANFDNRKHIINTPKSLEACYRLGISPIDLYSIDFNTFININNELKTLDKEVQELRYGYIEKTRLRNIQQCIKERNSIIEELKNAPNNNESRKLNKSPSNDIDPRILAEKKEIERIKIKQKIDLKNILDDQIKQEIIRKNAFEKEKAQKTKEDEIKRELAKKQKKEDEIRMKKEIQKQKLIEEEIKEEKKIHKLLELEEEKKREIEREKERLKKLEIKKIHEFENRKKLEKKIAYENEMKEKQEYLILKQRLEEEKEKRIRENIQKKKIEEINLQKKIEHENKKKLISVKIQENEKILMQKQEFEVKQRNIYMQKMKESEKKHEYIKKKKEVEIKKHIYKSQKDTHPDMTKTENHNEIRGKGEETKKLGSQINNQSQVVKSQSMNLKESNLVEDRVQNILTKMSLNEKKLIERKKKLDKERQINGELMMLKEESFNYNLKKIHNIQQYQNHQNNLLLKMREKKIEEFKKQKLENARSKKLLQEEIIRKKKNMMDNFDKMMRFSSTITPEAIQKMFPGDQEMIDKIMLLKSSFSNTS